MKRPLLVFLAAVLPACDRAPKPATPPPSPKAESVLNVPSPTNVPPPVQAASYDDGFRAGDLAGAAAAKTRKAEKPKERPVLPDANELDVRALEAAGTDVTRAEKWQRGFVAGFKDGFTRQAEGRK